MDRAGFDALTKLFASRGTRRMVLATIGAALLRPDLETARARTVRGHASERTTATATTGAVCYPGTRCTPGKGRNASRCDFAYSTYLKDRDARGANLSQANFFAADLSGADLRGANLSGSCLVHADLTGARLGGSVNLHQAIFCQTIMPDGSLNTADCGRGDACCPTPSQGAGAGCSLNDRSCSRNSDCCSNFCNSQGVCRNATENCRRLNELCGAFAGRCCSEEGTVCTGGILSRCSAPCRNDDECRQKFPQYDTGDQFMVCQPGGPCGDSACCARVCPFHPELCLY